MNPAVLIDPLGPTIVKGQPIYGIRTAPAQINGSAERLNEMFREVGMAVVLVGTLAFGDVRRRLDRIGFRAAYHAEWLTDPLLADNGAAIASWLASHTADRWIAVERPGVAPAGGITIDVPAGCEVPAVACRATTSRLQ